jgi:Zn-dependent protease with chaperone function
MNDLTSTAIGLAVLAALLAWPVPVLLARAAWPQRAPATALLLWQAVAVAGGLSMVGAPIVLGLAPLGRDVAGAASAGIRIAQAGAVPLPATSWLLFLIGGGLAGYLLGHLVSTTARVERHRRRHSELVQLLSSPDPDNKSLLLIDDDAPVAYCLPNGLHPVTVVSRGLVERLSPLELSAVIAHERAHAEQRHDVVALAFRAWRSALPGFPAAALAERAVRELVELLADDRARRIVGDRTLARTIVLAAGPDGRSGHRDGEADGGVPAARVRRLLDDTAALPVPAIAGARLLAVALVTVPTLWIVLPTLLG